ncbi:MAG: hypothetical protein MUF84_17065 [Anaerolineae bacterium]|nr:hypothetical protein [Anaerolineae bacterium]
MTRKQKLVVAILGAANVLVIGGLGLYAWLQRRSSAVPHPPLGAGSQVHTAVPTTSACATFLLESAEVSGWDARVSEMESVLYYEVSTGESATLALPVSTDEAVTVAADQMIWTVLDSLSPEYAERCRAAVTVSVTAIVVDGLGVRQQATAQVPGDVLALWVQGLTSDDDLAARARFRSSAQLLP